MLLMLQACGHFLLNDMYTDESSFRLKKKYTRRETLCNTLPTCTFVYIMYNFCISHIVLVVDGSGRRGVEGSLGEYKRGSVMAPTTRAS